MGEASKREGLEVGISVSLVWLIKIVSTRGKVIKKIIIKCSDFNFHFILCKEIEIDCVHCGLI